MSEYYDQRMRDFDSAQRSYENEEPFDEEEVEEPEYLESRCCMCPNRNSPESRVCPVGGQPKKLETPCRFVKSYRTGADVIVQVKQSRSDDKYYGYFNEDKAPRPFNSFDEAQSDINSFAKMSEWEEDIK